jgi:tryptophan 2,3-dioxygenase
MSATPYGRPGSGDASPPSRSFGEDGGRLSYGGYLRLPELLAQQAPQSGASDELLFITVHQVYELWFKLLLQELERIRDAMIEGALWRARHLFRRVHAVERVMVDQIQVLETMTPQDFLEFRSVLAPASGFQSVQFRELEFLSGIKDPSYLARLRNAGGEELARLRRRLAEPTLWDAYLTALSQRGLAVSDEDIMDSLLAVARDRGSYDDLWELAEDLLTHDETAALWRMRHVQMVERQIGTKSGTGGSSGAPYLRGRTYVHFFPLLWELRAWL